MNRCNDYESLGYGMTKNLPRVGSEVSINNCNHDRIGSKALTSTVRSSSTTLASSQLGDVNKDKSENRKTHKGDIIKKTEETPSIDSDYCSSQGRRRSDEGDQTRTAAAFAPILALYCTPSQIAISVSVSGDEYFQ